MKKPEKPPSHIVLRRPFSDDIEREEEPRWEKVGFAPSLAAAMLSHPPKRSKR